MTKPYYQDTPIRIMGMRTAKAFIREYHYAIESPSSCKFAIGLYASDKLVGTIIFGYGTRPLHTIRYLFPSLGTSDYLEINRLCLLDSCPRNSESQFIAQSINLVKRHFPYVKVIFSWADGLRGKPGYVYQAANFFYGGFIWSEFYMTATGEVVRPRLLITRYGQRDKQFTQELGLTKVHGYQFRYCKFICSHRERKRLIKESPIVWGLDYPKSTDLKWIIDAGEGSRESCELPMLKGSGQFRHPAPENQTVMPLV